MSTYIVGFCYENSRDVRHVVLRITVVNLIAPVFFERHLQPMLAFGFGFPSVAYLPVHFVKIQMVYSMLSFTVYFHD